MDNLTTEQRSKCMSNIRSKWTEQEKKIHNYLKGYKIKHKMHPNLPGKPDILLTNSNTAVFLQGCFWHKCPECFKKPKTNKKYWLPKLNRNVERDEENKEILEAKGFKVFKIWEHEVKKEFKRTLNRIKNNG